MGTHCLKISHNVAVEFFLHQFYRRNFSIGIPTVENIMLLNVEKILS